MSTPVTGFYQTGGTLRQDAPSYVERHADKELFESLLRGEFCYVLTSRQMGKSSLMNRTAARLREAGAAVAILDLTAIGQNLTVDQWYGGLLRRVGRAIDREDELEDYWLAQEQLGPLERWMAALQTLVLPRCSGQLVLFIDEIDAVRSLPFSTDEFFAAIRECYNRRTQDPQFERLTFCLLGVASPSDLIQDTRTTPFNIGKRIELTDFTPAEAAPLAVGLAPTIHEEHKGHKAENEGGGRPLTSSLVTRHSSLLLQRILQWTGGHPYLTQRLCQAAAVETTGNPKSKIQNPKWTVDRLCADLFLSPSAQETDDNLLFVRERLLKSEVERAGLLDLYGQVRAGRPVRVDDTNQLVTVLRLSGITRVAEGRLRVRNQIYERVFDPTWITQHMPDAELRRQRAAYRRGLWRAGGVSAAILAVMAGLVLTAVSQAHLARRQRQAADQQRQRAEEGQQALRHHLYAARMNLAQQAADEGNMARAQVLLESLRPQPGEEDLRGFEWRLLWRRGREDARFTLRGHGDWVNDVAFSLDGRTLAAAVDNGTVKLWNVASRQEIATLRAHPSHTWSVAFSPDDSVLATSGNDKTVRLWDLGSRRKLATLKADPAEAWSVAFSPDGRILACVGNGALKLWTIHRLASPGSGRAAPVVCREIASLKHATGEWHSLAFSPDGKRLATGSIDGTIHLVDLATQEEIAALRGHTGVIYCLAFSRDGKALASGSEDYTARVWDVAARRETAAFGGHMGAILSVTFSPDGRSLATSSRDATVKLWDLTTRRELMTLRGHKGRVNAIAFSPDGKLLASGSFDQTVKLWDPSVHRTTAAILRQRTGVVTLALSNDGRMLASSSGDGTVKLWSIAARHEIATLHGHRLPVASLAFSPDGKTLATGSDDHTIKLWDVASRRVRQTISGFQGGYFGLAFSPDGRTLALQGRDAVKLWALAAKRVLTQFPWELQDQWGLSFSPDGTTLAVSNGFEGVALWNVATRQAAVTVDGGAPPVFSPDSKSLALNATGGSVLTLWDAATGRLALSLRRERQGGYGFAFSPDGKTLADAIGNTVALWNLSVRQQAAVLRGHTGGVMAVVFSPDGNTLASGSSDGTIRLWQAAPFLETDPLRLAAAGGDRMVLLQWRPVLVAVGYRVYRSADVHADALNGPRAPVEPKHPNTRTPDHGSRFIQLTPRPVSGPYFIDHGPTLANGHGERYGVRTLFRGTAGTITEGPLVTVPARPAAVPPGYLTCSVDEGIPSGSVDFDQTGGAITIRGSGADIYNTADQFFFLCQLAAGDFQMTVNALTLPKATQEWAQAGLMVRESLDPGSRHAMLLVTAKHGLQLKWRAATDDVTDTEDVVPRGRLKLPVLLRLTRRGNTITAASSQDGGRGFRPLGDPVVFDPPLPPTVLVGLATAGHSPPRLTETKFSGLEIRPR